MSIVDALGEFGVITIHESQGRRGLLARLRRPIFRPLRISDNALTCEVPPGGNWSIHVSVAQARLGDILVGSPTGLAPHPTESHR
jgi:4-hydroxy-4-methyl-2-oxoglutarate aldolase